MYPTLKLKTGKEAAITYGHPWIFTGAFESMPESVTHGMFVHVADRKGEIIATGSFSRRGSIAVRVFALGKITVDRAFLEHKIRAAAERRALMGFGPGTETTGYRVFFGESDGIPGLVVDRFGDTAVFQIATASLDAMRADVIAAITTSLDVANIVERSDMSGRREEGLEAVKEVRLGSVTAPVPFTENGVSLTADVLGGQKTGFFCDQKDLRALIAKMTKGANILNLFSYTGAAGVYAMKGGAERVHNVDESAHALEEVKRNAELNGIDPEKFTTEEADIFQWLGSATGEYDIVMIDPPAIIKSQKDIESGAKAYHFLNRAAMKLVKNGGLLITSSCSHFMTEDDLMYTLRRASVQAGVRLETVAAVRQSADHPVSVYFPESAYLKSFICQVKKV